MPTWVPPPTLSTTRTNLDPQLDTHVADHNGLAVGVNDITAHIDSRVSVRKQWTTAGSIPNATWTRLSYGTLEFTHGQSIRGDGQVVTSDAAGLMLIFGQVYWSASNGAGRRILGISGTTTANPTADYQSTQRGAAGGMVQTICLPWATRDVSSAYLYCYQDSGATMTLSWRRATVLRLTHEEY